MNTTTTAEYTAEPNRSESEPGAFKVYRKMDHTNTRVIVAACDEDEAKVIAAALNAASLPYRD